ncbi:hypothetical protein T484DRAFT_2524119 [Baffinella frigidus]|nr:hypothetical protein T484DRAFT_2524119 [Cryptophyta sp. CCMP2293]
MPTDESFARAAVLMSVHGNTMHPSTGIASQHLSELDKLGALELREDGTSQRHSPFRCLRRESEEEDVEDGSSLQAEYERRLGAGVPKVIEAEQTSKTHETAAHEQPGAAQEQAASPWAKVVVSVSLSTESLRGCRVHECDIRWLRLFGFSSADCQNRSMLIVTGPKTDQSVVSQLCSSAKASASSPQWATLYKKSGEELSLVLRATLVVEGEFPKERLVALEMQSLAGPAAPEEDLEEEAAIHLSSHAPHAVSRANAQCEALLGVTESRLKERGMADIFSEQTSRMSWQNLIQGAAEGSTRSCLMSLRGALVVVMEVSPDTAAPRAGVNQLYGVSFLYPKVVVRMRLPLDAPPASPPFAEKEDLATALGAQHDALSASEADQIEAGACANSSKSGEPHDALSPSGDLSRCSFEGGASGHHPSFEDAGARPPTSPSSREVAGGAFAGGTSPEGPASEADQIEAGACADSSGGTFEFSCATRGNGSKQSAGWSASQGTSSSSSTRSSSSSSSYGEVRKVPSEGALLDTMVQPSTLKP